MNTILPFAIIFIAIIIILLIVYFLNKRQTKLLQLYNLELLKVNEYEILINQKRKENELLTTDNQNAKNENSALNKELTEIKQVVLLKSKEIEYLEQQNSDLQSGIDEEIAINKQNISEKQSLQKSNHHLEWQLQSLQAINETISSKLQSINEEFKTTRQLLSKTENLLAEQNARNNALQYQLAEQKQHFENLQAQNKIHFTQLAQDILDNKKQQITEHNAQNIQGILNPLKEDIVAFKQKVEETYDKESKERFTLEARVKDLIEHTNSISKEASNLANALKNQVKTQGNWGEVILENILELSGLSKDREYTLQPTIYNEEGKQLRPDVLVHLPDNRKIIIDSKVSLVAYDKWHNSDIAEIKNQGLKEHLRSVYTHIDLLSSKNYDNLESALDFTMLFIPIEPAYLLAIQSDVQLWQYAYQKRVLLISPTNLIACLKLMSDLWNREQQNKNAMEIVRRGELLYEKCVSFVYSMEDIGKHIEKAENSYKQAFNQLRDGNGSIISQSKILKSLGLKSLKKMPEN
ncbi:DNA recombination protein RmuC [Polluticaenibacter yanchengensis]|uniref:DNA recombination protein RmuC n=1 Tax=Polluticaenibacter yanchengensis TaxID=3014562 RepID=A0ABT4UHW2_9BACT|nr:DNA recombination protein RmuC [Chitinophagaceae bacterium LY-5]